MTAHLAGVPVEEALLSSIGAGIWLLLARGYVAARLPRAARVRRRRRAGTLPP